MSFLNYTYSFVARRAGTHWFAACDTPICASCSGGTPAINNTYGLYKSSNNGVSCSQYKFTVTSNNTRVSIEQCLVAAPTSSGGIIMPFTHSLLYNFGDIGFVCSATAPQLESGSWTDFGSFPQPNSCSCGTNYRTTTSTSTTSTTTSATQSWNLNRFCECNQITSGPGRQIVLNFSKQYWTAGLGRGVFISIATPSNVDECYEINSPVRYNASYTLYTGLTWSDCVGCHNGINSQCTTTTTTSTTILPGITPNCNCGIYQCSYYTVQGSSGDAIKWNECSQSLNSFRNFNYYYFYSSETIDFCACDDPGTLFVVSGTPTINGTSYTSNSIIARGNPCFLRSGCTCNSFPVELGKSVYGIIRPVLVEYDSCYEPTGGFSNPQKSMWPLSSVPGTFPGLPGLIQPWWPQALSGRPLFGRDTHVYSICACGAAGATYGDGNFRSPTFSQWESGPYIPITRAANSSNIGNSNEYFIHYDCAGRTCSCINRAPCTTSTTTMSPCQNCRSTVIGAAGPNLTEIVYEACDNFQKHLIVTESLYQGFTTSICACERCRQVNVRPLISTTASWRPVPYVHCCDPVFSQANYAPPAWHSSVLNLQVNPCRNYYLNSYISATTGATVSSTYKYVDCADSQIKYITATAQGTYSSLGLWYEIVAAANQGCLSFSSSVNPNVDYWTVGSAYTFYQNPVGKTMYKQASGGGFTPIGNGYAVSALGCRYNISNGVVQSREPCNQVYGGPTGTCSQGAVTGVLICASTVSFVSGSSSEIGSDSPCGTASTSICISKDYYGNSKFPDDPILGSIPTGIFTFSNIGSCSCITSDNQYILPRTISQSGISLTREFLTITFSNATCSQLVALPRPAQAPLPQPRPPTCCTCRIFSINLSIGDVVTYRPCDSNYETDTFVGIRLPALQMSGSTTSTGSFSVRLQTSGFYNIASFSVVFNHDRLIFYTASILQSVVSSGRFSSSGSFSRFAYAGSPINFGGGDLLNMVFAARSSARLNLTNISSSSFYQSTNVSNSNGVTFSVSLIDGWVEFPGVALPPPNINSIPPSFPSFP